MVSIDIPSPVGVMFYIVDPLTESLVDIEELVLDSFSSNVIPVYMVSEESRLAITLNITGSSNVIAKILDGDKYIGDFTVQNFNSIQLLNIDANTPYRLTIMIEAANRNFEEGEFEILWSI